MYRVDQKKKKEKKKEKKRRMSELLVYFFIFTLTKNVDHRNREEVRSTQKFLNRSALGGNTHFTSHDLT